MITRNLTIMLLSVMILASVTPLISQPEPVKWGKISDKEREMKVCYIDSAAPAVVLCSYGEVSLNSSVIVTKKHIRIKILAPEGKKYANREIPYNHSAGEWIDDLKAQTINFGEDGKKDVQNVNGKDFYWIDLNNGMKAVRFAFPAVVPGSIIEYQYTAYSEDFAFLDGWIFQNYEPTIHSEFRASIWERINYKVLISGENLLKKYDNKDAMNRWILQDLKPLRDEPYCYNKFDYADRIRFQLKGYRSYEDFDGYVKGNRYKNFILSWTDLAEELLEYKPFNGMLNSYGPVEETIEEMDIGSLPVEVRVDSIYRYVVNHFTWNGNYALIPNQNPEQLFESRRGNSTELNLLLRLLLLEAGIKVKTLIISSREHGKISKDYPLLSQFNHVILLSQEGNRKIFMDATSPYRPYHLPDLQDLGQEALLLDSTGVSWITVEPLQTSRKDFLVTLDYQADTVKVVLNTRSTGYFAEAERMRYDKNEEKEQTVENIVQGRFEVENFSVSDIDNPGEAFRLKADLRSTGQETNEGYLYVQPFIARDFMENPFNGKTRFLPVELPFEYTYHYIVNIITPEGYLIAELPRDEFHALSNEWGSFTYQCKSMSKNLQVVVDIKINRRIFHEGYYRHLSEFYSIISEKLGEMIVLKKVNL